MGRSKRVKAKVSTRGTATGINKGKEKHSPLIDLSGIPMAGLPTLLLSIKRGVPEPVGRGRMVQDQWDHLICKLDRGSTVTLETKIANSVARRAKNIGYVVRLTKLDSIFTELWFGGFQGIPKAVKV